MFGQFAGKAARNIFTKASQRAFSTTNPLKNITSIISAEKRFTTSLSTSLFKSTPFSKSSFSHLSPKFYKHATVTTVTTGGATLGYLSAAAGVLPTPIEHDFDDGEGELQLRRPQRNDRDQDTVPDVRGQRPPQRRGSNRDSPEVAQNDTFHPRGRPPNPVPALSWQIRRDVRIPRYSAILKEALSPTWSTRGPPVFDETKPQESVRELISKIIHDLHRVSICLPHLAQSLSLVNSSGQMYNREKKRTIIPMFSLDNLASFQRRLIHRYQRIFQVYPEDPDNASADQLKEVFEQLQGALQLAQYDTALLYSVDQSLEMFHPKHPKSFLQQSIKAQGDYFIQRRGLIAKQIRAENPDIEEKSFQEEFNKRVVADTQLINEMLEQRRIEEQRRWAQMQRASIVRARQRRHSVIEHQKKAAMGDNSSDDGHYSDQNQYYDDELSTDSRQQRRSAQQKEQKEQI